MTCRTTDKAPSLAQLWSCNCSQVSVACLPCLLRGSGRLLPTGCKQGMDAYKLSFVTHG